MDWRANLTTSYCGCYGTVCACINLLSSTDKLLLMRSESQSAEVWGLQTFSEKWSYSHRDEKFSLHFSPGSFRSFNQRKLRWKDALLWQLILHRLSLSPSYKCPYCAGRLHCWQDTPTRWKCRSSTAGRLQQYLMIAVQVCEFELPFVCSI